MSRILVVGGGAAGMMAAYTAAKNGHRVTLIEKNEKLGKKIYITGKGRCNVTNAGETAEFFEQVVRNPKSLYSAVYSFDAFQVMAFLEEHGCPIKVERGNRVFPVSDHASDVIRACARAMEHAGVQVRLNTKAERLITEAAGERAKDAGACAETVEACTEDAGACAKTVKVCTEDAGACAKTERERTDKDREAGLQGDCFSDTGREQRYAKMRQSEKKQLRVCGVVLAGGERLNADAVIVATGGLSYPTTGSDGDGLRFAEELGIEAEPCRPALVPFVTREEWCRRLQGLALKNVAVSLKRGTTILYTGQGEMLFTHFGVSGPLILSASSYYANACGKRKTKRSAQECAEGGMKESVTEDMEDMILSIDLKPALSKEVLDKRLLREFEENRNKQFKNAVEGLFPAKLIPVMVSLSGIAETKPVHDITKEERIRFAERIKALPLTIAGTRGYAEAVITQGGISVKEINPSTMESKRVTGLYFAGEVLDVDALTGGYNLQIAWATGHLAGESAG